MDAKSRYEQAASIAEALPEGEREEFAALMSRYAHLALLAGEREDYAPVSRWLKDSGWRS